MPMRYLIGIDDTDNLDSRGTGFRARQLGARLGEAGLGETLGITRHQLFVHPNIPYTSHNSSACLDVTLNDGAAGDLRDFCRDYLAAESAEGSDAGLCIAAFDAVADHRRLLRPLRQGNDADPRTGPGRRGRRGPAPRGRDRRPLGVIGALSAVGLRRGGHDGRFIWLRGVRELSGTAPRRPVAGVHGHRCGRNG